MPPIAYRPPTESAAIRLARDAEMRAYESMMEQQRVQQMEAQQWRFQQQLRSPAGYPPDR